MTYNKRRRALRNIHAMVLMIGITIAIVILLYYVPMDVEGKDGDFGGGSGTSGDPFLIEDVHDLQAMKDGRNKHYALANDIDASDTVNWNDGAGFVPIGADSSKRFTGSLAGHGYGISGLFIDYATTKIIGLFGYLGQPASVSNVGLVDVNVTGLNIVGGLVGLNVGVVSNCYATGTVSGDSDIGGLVGRNADGSVSSSYAMGTVSGDNDVGGLIGNNGALVSNCYATGTVSGDSDVGGLVGLNMGGLHEGSMSNCYATGTVSGDSDVGGLVGLNGGSMSNCYATGNVTGDSYVGGLVGLNVGSMSNCNTTGNVTGDSNVGGLVGFNDDGRVSNSHYNIDTGVINGGHHVTLGGLFNEQYQDWLANGKVLDIADYSATLVPWGDHYEIAGVEGLRNLLGFTGSGGYTFRLACDIDLSTAPDFYIPYLAAKFDGDSYVISNLRIDQNFAACQGMFGYIDRGGSVSNMSLGNVNITGNNYVGGLVGWNRGSMSNCYATGIVSGDDYVGGLVGRNLDGSVSNSSFTGTVTGNDYVGGLVGKFYGSVSNSSFIGIVTGDDYVGGLLGENYYGSVSNSYFMGTVTGDEYVSGLSGRNYGTLSNCITTGTVIGNRYVGGLVGHNAGSVANSFATGTLNGYSSVGGLVGRNYGTVTNSYATGNVTGDINAGGLVGFMGSGSVSKCYATGNVTGDNNVGGLVGDKPYGSVENSFWDIETTNLSISAGGTGKTTAEMKTLSTFSSADWDFSNVWYMIEHVSYPLLRCHLTPNAGSDQVINEGSMVSFDGSASKSYFGIINYTWTFTDGIGNVVLYGSNPTHTFTLPGIYVITLNVTDATGLWDTDNMTVTVNNIKPEAGILDISPNPALDTDTVTFEGYGTDYGSIIRYAWHSSLDGELCNDTTAGFDTDDLSPGEHTIFFRVQDNYGEWSDEVNATVNILKDSDNDTIPDNIDAFPNNPNEWDDTDGDGTGDNSDAFPNDPAASKDTDGDGYPDEWNNGKTEDDSTTGLKLDLYPGDSKKWEKKNDDGGFIPGFELMILIVSIAIAVMIDRRD